MEQLPVAATTPPVKESVEPTSVIDTRYTPGAKLLKFIEPLPIVTGVPDIALVTKDENPDVGLVIPKCE
jgi:hypothetical protein